MTGDPLSPAARRAELFRETPLEWCERHVLGAVWALKPARIAGLPYLARMVAADLLAGSRDLPDPEAALELPYGLAGICHDLSVPTLIEAHRRGLYPFCHIGPMKWWSPPQRCVLFFDEFHLAKRLRRQMRQAKYRVTFDEDFEGVIAGCAGRREGKWHVTWVTPTIMEAYTALFDAGHAHSFEVWNEAGALVGGGYGVAIGSAFVAESQFSREPNTSKIGFTVLNRHLAKWGFAFNDGKMTTPTILDMGFRSIPRSDYLGRLTIAAAVPRRPGRWQVEDDVKTVADWQPDGAAADAD